MNSGDEQRASGTSRAVVDDEVDYYKLLKLPYTATRQDVTRAYRAAMKRAHPDRHHPDSRRAAEERAKLLNRAYSTLSRDESRRAYDARIKGSAVQDQIMSQYFGGFGMPDSGDLYGERLRRRPADHELRDQQRNDRQAMVSIVIVFAGVAAVVVVMLVLWAAISAAFDTIF